MYELPKNRSARSSCNIHYSAIISDDVILGENVYVGAYSIIEGKIEIGDNTIIKNSVSIEGSVKIGKNCKIENNVTIRGTTLIGNSCRIWPYVTIGCDAQDIKYKGEPSEVQIGENCLIREHVTIHRGTSAGGGKTVLGKNCFILSSVHIGHDCILGDGVIIVSRTLVGGACRIGNFANISGVSALRHKITIGDYAMTTMVSCVRQDVTPFTIVTGIEKTKAWKTNSIGLERRSFSKEDIKIAENVFNIFFRKKFSQEEAFIDIEKKFGDHVLAKLFVDFVKNSSNGITR